MVGSGLVGGTASTSGLGEGEWWGRNAIQKVLRAGTGSKERMVQSGDRGREGYGKVGGGEDGSR